MTPERFAQIEAIYHQVLECEPGKRAEFLATACAGDDALRWEVESLLAQHASEPGSLDRPAWAGADWLTAGNFSETIVTQGTQLGPYKIEGPLGAGGMGEVYRAEDTRLGRKVAIKFSREQYSERFKREAKAIAALNHPNICTLHDIGPNYMVMELLDGETLSARIRRGALPVEEMLQLGRQMADALAAAHAQGIVHRDLKPANIMLTKNGLKVLDFGLAKVEDTEAESLTGSRMVMGTPGYMAPEQVKGEPAGPAADLFALGLVLYEMAEGKQPVPGLSLGSALASGTSTKIPPLTLRAPASKSLNALIAQLLEVAPDRRPASAALVRDELNGLAGSRPRQNRRAWIAAAAGLLALALIGLWRSWNGDSTRPLETVKLTKFTSFPGQERDPEFSPDGRSVAFSWSGESGKNVDIYVMATDSQTPVRLTQDPAEDVSPMWSPDGGQIAFVRIGAGLAAKIVLIPAAGGPERVLRECRLIPDVRGAMRPLLTWTPDGKQILYAAQDEFGRATLYLTDVAGAAGRKLLPSEEASFGNSSPAISRDGKWLAYSVVYGPGTSRLYVRSLTPELQLSSPPTAVSEPGPPYVSLPVWAPDSKKLLFVQGHSIFEWKEGGKPRQIFAASNVLAGMSASWQAGRSLRIVFGDATDHTELRMVRLKPGGLGASGDSVPFAASTSTQTHPQYSPDGRNVVFLSTRSGATEIWGADADGRSPQQLTHLNPGNMGYPRWSHDGKRIAFHAWAGFHPQIFIMDFDPNARPSATSPRKITDSPFGFFSPTWSLDEKYLYVDGPGTYRLYRFSMSGGTAEDLFEGAASKLTLDGKRILYSKVGHLGVFARNLDGDVSANPEEKLVDDYLSPGADLNPVSDGFYYVGCDPAGQLRAIRFYSYAQKTSVDVFVLTGVMEPYRGLAIAPDRSRVVFEQSAGSGTDLALLELR